MTFRPRHRLPRGGDCCDFCGGKDVQALYSCANFNWEGRPVFQQDAGRWAACWLCSQYIETQNWGQLNRRVMREVSKREGLTPEHLDAMRATLKILHALFAQHVVRGEAFKVHRPHVRRFMLAPV